MSQEEPIQSILQAIGDLAGLILQQPVGVNDPASRLQEILQITRWAQETKINYSTQCTLRIQLQDQLQRLKSNPAREDILMKIDRTIQTHMQQLNVDIRIGSQLLPRIMDVVESQINILIQEIDDVTAQANNLVVQRDQANFRCSELENVNRKIQFNPTFVESQLVDSTNQLVSYSGRIECLENQLIEANSLKLEYQQTITRLQEQIALQNTELEHAKLKNSDLISQITISNSVIGEFESKVNNLSKLGLSNSQNDANIKIISEHKEELHKANERIAELVQKIIDANVKSEDLERRLAKKNSVQASPVQEHVEVRNVADPRVKELQVEIISKQEEINALSANLRNSEARINQLINELMSANGEVAIWKSKSEVISHFDEKDEIITSLRSQLEELARLHNGASNRIKELEHELYGQNNRDVIESSDVKHLELATLLARAEHKNTELMNQLEIYQDKNIALQEHINSLSQENQNSAQNQRENETIANALVIAESKIKEMMRIVANYQNNVIDLQLDKEALGIQLNDSRNRQQDYLDDLKVERASVSALKDQIIKIKEGFRGIARQNIREIEVEISDKAQGREAHRVSDQFEHEKSEKSHRGHRKIFDSGFRESRASNNRQANVQK